MSIYIKHFQQIHTVYICTRTYTHINHIDAAKGVYGAYILGEYKHFILHLLQYILYKLQNTLTVFTKFKPSTYVDSVH